MQNLCSENYVKLSLDNSVIVSFTCKMKLMVLRLCDNGQSPIEIP